MVPGLELHADVILLNVMFWWAGTSYLTCALKGCCFQYQKPHRYATIEASVGSEGTASHARFQGSLLVARCCLHVYPSNWVAKDCEGLISKQGCEGLISGGFTVALTTQCQHVFWDVGEVASDLAISVRSTESHVRGQLRSHNSIEASMQPH